MLNIKPMGIFVILLFFLITLLFLTSIQAITSQNYISQSGFSFQIESCTSGACTPNPSATPPTEKPDKLSKQTNYTNTANLVTINNISGVSLTNNRGYIYMQVNLNDLHLNDISLINSINYTTVGWWDVNSRVMTAYTYNYSSQLWIPCGNNITNDANTPMTANCMYNGLDMINQTNNQTFLLVQKVSNGEVASIDYISINVSYNGTAGKPILNTTNNSNFSTSTLTLKWNNVTYTGTSNSTIIYHLQLDNNSDFSSLEYNNNTILEKITPTNITLSSLVDGVYYWRVESNTSTEELSGYGEIFNFRVDTISPSITISQPTNITYKDLYQYNYSLNVTISDSGAGEQARWWTLNNGISNTTFTGNTTITILVPGNNTVIVYANDTLGNRNSSNVTFSLIFTPKINDINISNSTNSYDRNQNTSLSDGLVGWWKFDENNINQIDSTGNSNGTVTNATFNANGKVGGAYTFDGDADYITINTYPKINFTIGDSYAITFWTNLTDSRNDKSFTEKWNPSAGGYPWAVRTNTNGRIQFLIYNGTTGQSIVSSTTNVNSSTYRMITAVNNGTAIGLYIDNALVTSFTTITLIGNFGFNNFTIGSRVYSNTAINATIDEVRIYNRSLTPDEVQNLYYITNPTFQEYANITINVTITDEDTPQANLFYRWLIDGVQVLSGLAQNVLNYIFNKVSQIITLEVNDTYGYNVNQTFNISTIFIKPLISIISPLNNSNLSSSIQNVNYTVSDANLQSCWWTNNTGVTNRTITCGANISAQTWDEGTNNVTIYANDSVNNINSSSVKFTVDTTPPLISIVYPTDFQSFTSQNNIQINYTILENGIGLSSCWWTNNTGVTNRTITCGNNITLSESGSGNYQVTIYANDSLSNNASSTIHYAISLNGPAVTLNYPINNTWVQNGSNFNFNVTATDANGIKNCSLWGNWTGTWKLNQTNVTAITSGTRYTFYQNLTDGFYSYNFECYDTTDSMTIGPANFSFGIDTINPTVNLTIPLNISYNVTSLQINFTSNDTNKESCYYSTNSGGLNTTISNCQNTSYTASQGSTNLILYVNDSSKRQNSSNITFFVDSITALGLIVFPSANATYFNYNTSVNINISVSDTNLQSCEYKLDGGSYNLFTCSNNVTLNVSDESLHTVIFKINDTLNNLNDTSFISFYSDTKSPIISNIQITTTGGSQTISFSHDITETYAKNCTYAIYTNVGAIDGLNNNVSITCGGSGNAATVTSYNDFQLYICGTDNSLNEGCANQSFTTTSEVSLSQSSGASSLDKPKSYPVVCLIKPANYTNPISNLERCRLYEKINSFCSSNQKQLSIIDNSKTCSLTNNNLLLLSSNLSNFINLSDNQMKIWYSQYKQGLIENLLISLEDIEKYNLIQAIVGLTNKLKLTPSNVDQLFLINQGEGSKRISMTILSNKPLKSCEIISNALGFECDLISQEMINLSYNISDTKFFTNSYQTKIFLTTDSNTENQETASMPILFRVVNIGHYSITFIIFAIIIGLLVFSVIFFNKKRKINIKKLIPIILLLTFSFPLISSSNVINETVICAESYYFLIDNIIPNNTITYNSTDLIELSENININYNINISYLDLNQYMINYTQKCENITNLKIPISNNNSKNNIIYLNYQNIENCDTDINKTIFGFDMDDFISIPKEIIQKDITCDSIQTQKYFLSYNNQFENYFITGIKTWWIYTLTIFIIYTLFLIVVFKYFKTEKNIKKWSK